MKKLLWILVISVITTPFVSFSQSPCEQPESEVYRIYDFQANNTIFKTLFDSLGNLWVFGTFSQITQYDKHHVTTQVLGGLSGIAKKDFMTGIWQYEIGLTGGFMNAWIFNGTFYVNHNASIKKRDPITGTWSNGLFYVTTDMVQSTTPHEFHVAVNLASYPGIGMFIWNENTGVFTPMSNAELATSTGGYYRINYDDKFMGDTLMVHYSYGNYHINKFLIRGQTALLNWGDINATPGFGTASLGYAPLYYNITTNSMYLVTGGYFSAHVLYWNGTTWTELYQSSVYPNALSSDYTTPLFYDSVTERLYLPDFIVGVHKYIHVPTNTIHDAGFTAEMRFQNQLRDRTLLAGDSIAPAKPNTMFSTGTTITSPNTITYTGDNGHIGDIAKVYEYGNVIDSLTVDSTNCTNFSFALFADWGVHDYEFTLTDPYGNESDKTLIHLEVSAPNGTHDVDNSPLLGITTLGKTISVKSQTAPTLIQVCNSWGQVIFSEQRNETHSTINLETVATGMYILKAHYPHGEYAVRKIAL